MTLVLLLVLVLLRLKLNEDSLSLSRRLFGITIPIQPLHSPQERRPMQEREQRMPHFEIYHHQVLC
jgi:hypothetical protein